MKGLIVGWDASWANSANRPSSYATSAISPTRCAHCPVDWEPSADAAAPISTTPGRMYSISL